MSTCATCRFWRRLEGIMIPTPSSDNWPGQCRRHAPVIFTHRGPFPCMPASGMCGEHQTEPQQDAKPQFAIPPERLASLEQDEALLDWADKEGHHDASYPSLRAELRDKGAKMPMVQQDARACVCGDPTAVGVVHRQDGPCFQPDGFDLPAAKPAAPTGGPGASTPYCLKQGPPTMPGADEAAVDAMVAAAGVEGSECRRIITRILPWHKGEIAAMTERAARAEAVIANAERLPDDERDIIRQRDAARANADALAEVVGRVIEWAKVPGNRIAPTILDDGRAALAAHDARKAGGL